MSRFPVILDGAHNPSASETLATALQQVFGESSARLIMVVGIMIDKDISGILSPLLPLADDIICTAPHDPRAASPSTIAETAVSLGYPAPRTAPTVKDALALAEKIALEGSSSDRHTMSNPHIVITGSFYTIGEAKEALGETAVFGDLRESR